jgi:hypothetical protein
MAEPLTRPSLGLTLNTVPAVDHIAGTVDHFTGIVDR